MKIAIDLGHGVGQDGGANGLIKEETIINNVGSFVINKLKALGHSVIEVRPQSATTTGNSLTQRVNKANNNGCDLFVSIHANAGGGYGTEVFTYNAKEVSQARNILNNIVALGFRNRGIKDGKNLYVIKHSNMTAMLIEICFIDTQNDVNLYNSLGAEKIADAIVKGLTGTTIKTSNQNTTNNPSTSYFENTGIKTSFNAHIRDLQQAINLSYNKGLVVDGLFGANTNNALKNIILKNGTKNSVVGWIQCRVGSSIDNSYGPNTTEAVKNFQKQAGFSAKDIDGIVGYQTLCAIIKKFQ